MVSPFRTNPLAPPSIAELTNLIAGFTTCRSQYHINRCFILFERSHYIETMGYFDSKSDPTTRRHFPIVIEFDNVLDAMCWIEYRVGKLCFCVCSCSSFNALLRVLLDRYSCLLKPHHLFCCRYLTLTPYPENEGSKFRSPAPHVLVTWSRGVVLSILRTLDDDSDTYSSSSSKGSRSFGLWAKVWFEDRDFEIDCSFRPVSIHGYASTHVASFFCLGDQRLLCRRWTCGTSPNTQLNMPMHLRAGRSLVLLALDL